MKEAADPCPAASAVALLADSLRDFDAALNRLELVHAGRLVDLAAVRRRTIARGGSHAEQQ